MSITIVQVRDTVEKLCSLIIQNEVFFCELDSVAGDGDFGMSLAKGFREVQKQMDELDKEDISKFLRSCSLIISEFCGGASGPIWGSAFAAGARASKGKQQLTLQELAEMFRAGVEAIQKRGGAKQGDKTLLDALIPATEALESGAAEGITVGQAFENAAQCAKEGAEATKQMIASKGRASYVGERSLSHPDAGAMAIGILFGSLVEG